LRYQSQESEELQDKSESKRFSAARNRAAKRGCPQQEKIKESQDKSE
jgi:hypothetical protein